jgi:glucosamine-6-phosphate deaminase
MTDYPPAIHRHATPQAVCLAAAAIVLTAIRTDPALILGLATGDTQLPLYAVLGDAIATDPALVRAVMTFNLDEYIGLGPADAGSFAAYMQRNLFRHWPPGHGGHHLPNGLAADPHAEARDYEAKIAAAGGIGLQVLGIGRNGHIAFNEPPSAPDSPTRVVTLSAQTRAANAAQFPMAEEVPHRAITMGMRPILAARRLLVIATGAAKRTAVERALGGPITPDCPASLLRLHPDVIFLLDDAAAV